MITQGGREAYEITDEAEFWEWLSSKAEAEYFAHVEGATHFYPPVGQSGIILANEPINLGESPF